MKSTELEYSVINILKPDVAPSSLLGFKKFTTMGASISQCESEARTNHMITEVSYNHKVKSLYLGPIFFGREVVHVRIWSMHVWKGKLQILF